MSQHQLHQRLQRPEHTARNSATAAELRSFLASRTALALTDQPPDGEAFLHTILAGSRRRERQREVPDQVLAVAHQLR